jgi:hypothetical protein
MSEILWNFVSNEKKERQNSAEEVFLKKTTRQI